MRSISVSAVLPSGHSYQAEFEVLNDFTVRLLSGPVVTGLNILNMRTMDEHEAILVCLKQEALDVALDWSCEK